MKMEVKGAKIGVTTRKMGVRSTRNIEMGVNRVKMEVKGAKIGVTTRKMGVRLARNIENAVTE